MKTIVLTGGIGSGKSTVAGILAGLGAVLVDTDRLGHEVLRPGSEAGRRALAEFGPGISAADGSIDRRKLGDIVFSDERARKKLNAITHPAIYAMVRQKLAELERQGAKVVVAEVPLYHEAGWDIADEVWTTTAPEEVIVKRLVQRSNLSDDEAKARIGSQLGREEYSRHADAVIDTNLPLPELEASVRRLWDRLAETP